MKVSKTRFIFNLIILFLVIGVVFQYKTELINIWKNAFSELRPCQSPLTYSIGTLDSQFGASKATLLADIQKAEKIWESSIDKPLFEYAPDGTGDLKINFIYDYRQKATDAMKKIGVDLNDDRSSYDALKSKYDTLLSSYTEKKAEIASLNSTFNSAKTEYENQVSYWNNHGGAPKDEYAKLESQRQSLNNQTIVINQKVNEVNSLVDTIKQVEEVLNNLVDTLNIKVAKYNNIGDSTGGEFNEGEYMRDAEGTRINIYQFKNENQLVRVLAHEFGHSIGLDHINNPKAIMYYLNEGVNEKLTNDDIAALKNRCGIK